MTWEHNSTKRPNEFRLIKRGQIVGRIIVDEENERYLVYKGRVFQGEFILLALDSAKRFLELLVED